MPLKVPRRHELRHHRLGADLRVPHIHGAALGECVDQRRRQHQVTQAQRRERDLAERPHIQHPPAAIQGRQRGQRRAAVTVLAVVVILDDPATAAFGPGQQLQAPGQAHDHSQWVLMGRRDIGQAAVVEAVQHAAVDPLAVHRHTLQLRTGQGEGMTGGAVAGIFNRHAITWAHQQLCTKADCLLRATGDHNLLSRTLHAPRAAQVGGDQAAQALVPGRVAIAQLIEVRLAPKSRIQLGPDVKREQVEGRNPHPKCPWRPYGRQGQMVVFEALQRRAVDNFFARNIGVFQLDCG